MGQEQRFWDGIVDHVGPYIEQSPTLSGLYVVAPTLAAVPIGVASLVDGSARMWCLIGGGVALVAVTAAEVLRQVYSRHRQESAVTSAATAVVALRGSLRPMAKAIADMQPLPRDKRRDRVEDIAHRAVEALNLIMAHISGIRSVVYREEGDTLRVVTHLGSREREPQDFERNTDRGDAAFETIARREPCFIRDVTDEDEVKAMPGAYSGTRSGYRTFISAPVFDNQNTYGMVTLDAPVPGDLLPTDKHLVMLVADMLAISFASVR